MSVPDFVLGEEIVEPEVDLSSFLERQRISDEPALAIQPEDEDDDDIDTSIPEFSTNTNSSLASNSKKGKVQQIEWDASLENLSREKASADATRGENFLSFNIIDTRLTFACSLF